MTAAGLPGQEFLPQGRAPQSMAFLSTAGIERLCSGVTNSRASDLGDVGFEAHHRFRQRGFEILVVQRQVVDADDAGVEGVGAELGQRLRQLAVDRFAPVAADDQAELELVPWGPSSFVVTNEY